MKILIRIFIALLILISFKGLAEEINLSERLTVKQFGATGDGKTDDTQAIQKALKFVFEKKGGGILEFPRGGYLITKPLIVPRNVNLVGQGLGFSSSIIPVDCDGVWIKGETQEGGFAFRNRIDGINLNMLRAGVHAAIVIDAAYNVMLSDVFVFAASGIGVEVKNSNHIAFDTLVVYGNKLTGKGVKILNSTVSMYNIDIEDSLIALEIGPNKNSNAQVSVFGGFIERFSKFGINILESQNNTFIGLNIQSNGKDHIPVSVDGNAYNRSENRQNTFIGGYIGFAKRSDKKNRAGQDFKIDQISETLNVGE